MWILLAEASFADSALPATGGGLLVAIALMLWNKFKPTAPSPNPIAPTVPSDPSSPLSPWIKIFMDLAMKLVTKQAVSSGVVHTVVSDEPPKTLQDLLDRMEKLVNAPSDCDHGDGLDDLVRCAQALKAKDTERDVFVTITEDDCDVRNPKRKKVTNEQK